MSSRYTRAVVTIHQVLVMCTLLMYRVLTINTCGKLHHFLHTLGFMKTHLVVTSIGWVICIFIWIVTPFDSKEIVLWILFASLGFLRSGLFPYTIRVINAICAYEGFVSMGFICAYGIGDALVTMINGKLITKLRTGVPPV